MTPPPLAHLAAGSSAPAGASVPAMDASNDGTDIMQPGDSTALFGDLLTGGHDGGAVPASQSRTKKEQAGSSQDTDEDIVSLIPTTALPLPPAAVLAQSLPISLTLSIDRTSDGNAKEQDTLSPSAAGPALTIGKSMEGDATPVRAFSPNAGPASPLSDLARASDADPREGLVLKAAPAQVPAAPGTQRLAGDITPAEAPKAQPGDPTAVPARYGQKAPIDPRPIDPDAIPAPVWSGLKDTQTARPSSGAFAPRPRTDPAHTAAISDTETNPAPNIVKRLEAQAGGRQGGANPVHDTGEIDRGTVTPATSHHHAASESAVSPLLRDLQAFLPRPHTNPTHAIAVPGRQPGGPPDAVDVLDRLEGRGAASSSESAQAQGTVQDTRNDTPTTVYRHDADNTGSLPSLRDLEALIAQFQAHHAEDSREPVGRDSSDPSWRLAVEMLDKLDKKGTAAAAQGETRQPVETGDGISGNDPRFPLVAGPETRADGRPTGGSSGEHAARHDGEPSRRTDTMAQGERDVPAGRSLPGAVPPASQPPLVPPGIPSLHNSVAGTRLSDGPVQHANAGEHQDHSAAHPTAASSLAGNRRDDVMAGLFPGALPVDRNQLIVPAAGHHAAQDALPVATAGVVPSAAHVPVRSEQLHTGDTEPAIIPNGIATTLAAHTVHVAESGTARRTDTPSPLAHVTEEIIVRQATLQTAGAASSFRAVLHPQDLGAVMVHVRRENTGLHVTLIPQQAEAQSVIDTHLSDLVDTLQRTHESVVHVHIQAPDQQTVLFDDATPAGLQANLGSGANGGYSNNAGSGQHFDDREPSGWSPQESPNVAGLASASVRSSRRPATGGIVRGRTARIDIQA